jgi:hypothetical protein
MAPRGGRWFRRSAVFNSIAPISTLSALQVTIEKNAVTDRGYMRMHLQTRLVLAPHAALRRIFFERQTFFGAAAVAAARPLLAPG